MLASTIRGINDISYDSVPMPKFARRTNENDHASSSTSSNTIEHNGRNHGIDTSSFQQRTGGFHTNIQNICFKVIIILYYSLDSFFFYDRDKMLYA